MCCLNSVILEVFEIKVCGIYSAIGVLFRENIHSVPSVGWMLCGSAIDH